MLIHLLLHGLRSLARGRAPLAFQPLHVRALPVATIPSHGPAGYPLTPALLGAGLLLAAGLLLPHAFAAGAPPWTKPSAVALGALGLWALAIAAVRRTTVPDEVAQFRNILPTVTDCRPAPPHRGVVHTAFVYPPAVASGAPTSAFIFLQNCTNRPRNVLLLLVADPRLGLKDEYFHLRLMRFEAAALRIPVRFGPNVRPATYELNVVIHDIRCPEGLGVQALRGNRGKFRPQRISVPVTVGPWEQQASQRGNALAPAEWVSLWHVGAPEPRPETIHALVHASPWMPIDFAALQRTCVAPSGAAPSLAASSPPSPTSS